MKKKKVKVIFDTNIWISFLIGRNLSKLKDQIVSGNITVITTPQLLSEIEIVTNRDKFKKYFPPQKVKELIELLNIIGDAYEIQPTHHLCRDPKDNFLLDLIHFSKADYLITGDKDLLEHNPFETAQIITPAEFEKLLNNQI